MRKYCCFCIYVIFLNFFFNNVYGQKDFRQGYLITNNLDTVFGLINFRSNSLNATKCEFKKNEKDSIKIYLPFDINSYVLTDSRYYVSKIINFNGEERKVFLEYLVDGILDLYYYNEGLREYYFIEKDGELTQLNNDEIETVGKYGRKYIRNTNQYKGALKKLFGDVTELDKQIMVSKFEFNSLVNITKDYHNLVCDNKTCIEYRKIEKKDIFCEVFSGIDYSYMGLTSSQNYAKDFQPLLGLNVRLKDNRYNSKISLSTGLNISNHSFNGEYKNTLHSDRIKYHRIELDYTLLRIPVTIEYTFLPDKFQPIVSLSFINSFLLNPRYKLELHNYFTDTDYASVDVESPLRKYEFGFSMGCGFKYQINQNSYLTCVLHAEYREPAVNLNYILDYINFKSMLFHIGYGFKIY